MPILGVIASSAKGAPGIPTSVSATDVGTGRAYNNGAATVSFTPGAGATATSFTATSSPGGFTATGASSPLTVTGLQSSTSYTFTVTATNAAGTSDPSAASASITATTVPQAPTIGTATAGNASATVTYTANATGGKAVSAYTATSSPGSLTGTGTSPITVSGLTNGTAYTFTVTATNANGTSAASAASNSVTPALPPVGTNWTLGTLPAPANAMTTSVNSSRWYFQQNNAIQTMWYSTTGLTWTSVGSITGLSLYSPIRGSAAQGDQAVYVTLNSDSSKGAYTNNGGVSWSDQTTGAWGTSVWAGGVAADGTSFVVSKQLSATQTAYSTNGSSWFNVGTLAAADYPAVSYSADTGTYKWAIARNSTLWYFATSSSSGWTLRTMTTWGGRNVGSNWGKGSVFMGFNNGTTEGVTTTGASDASTQVTFPFAVGGLGALSYASTPGRWIVSSNAVNIGTSDNNGATWTIRTTPSGFNNADTSVYNSTINRAIISATGQTAIAYSG